MGDSRHEFGGDWTGVKLEAIRAYSKFFTAAIGGIFDLWYVDPFAGTGERTATEQAGGLFDQQPISSVEKQYPGSAARVLAVAPPFNHLRFGDSKRRHVRALQALVDLHPNRDASVVPGDANHFIQQMFWAPPWRAPDQGPARSRALVFLDPEQGHRTHECGRRCGPRLARPVQRCRCTPRARTRRMVMGRRRAAPALGAPRRIGKSAPGRAVEANRSSAMAPR
jgi:hypothetical protein